jgi:hypothetical protein
MAKLAEYTFYAIFRAFGLELVENYRSVDFEDFYANLA